MLMHIPPYALIIPLLAGYLLDLALGDPAGLTHPIRVFGWLIAKGETCLNKPSAFFLKGMMLTLMLGAGCFFFFDIILALIRDLSLPCYYFVCSIFVFYGLANRQLVKEGTAVFTALQHEGIAAARKSLSRIVGRDTATLAARQVRIAVLETLSENLSDAVIAPLFYYALAGVPGMMAYKMINTMDSMIGYRNERFERFGKFAARTDDVVNFIPARLTALLMILVTASIRGASFILQFGRLHKSPNAGYPEAALAGILDTRFGGPNLYHGALVEKPYIGNNDRDILPDEIKKVCRINHRTCLLMILLIIFAILKIEGDAHV